VNRIDDLVAEYGSGGVEFIPLKDIGTWYGGGTPSKQEPEFWSRGTIPWLSPKDMRQPVVSQTQDYITEAAVKHSATKLVPANSVALVVRSSILDHTLPIALVPVPITLNQDMKAVLPNDSVVPGYLAHLLRSLGPELLRTVRKTGGSVASLEYPKLLAQKVPVPPLAVQREIASILDEMEGVKAELESDLEFELEYRSRQFAFHRDQLLTTTRTGRRTSALLMRMATYPSLRRGSSLEMGKPTGTSWQPAY
jgi:restriction endonuclease S subunit